MNCNILYYIPHLVFPYEAFVSFLRWNLDVRTNPKREGCERSEDANNKVIIN